MLGSNPLKTLTAPSFFALATIASRLVSKMKPLASASFFAFNKAALDSAAEPFVVSTKLPRRRNNRARVHGSIFVRTSSGNGSWRVRSHPLTRASCYLCARQALFPTDFHLCVLVATTFCYRLNSLVLLRQFLSSSQFIVGLCHQVLGAHVRDSGNFVLQPANQLFLAQHVLESRRQTIERKWHRFQTSWGVAGSVVYPLFRVRRLQAESFVEVIEILEIFRHIADKPVRADQPFEKTLDQIRALLEYPSGRSDNPLGTSIGILVFWHHENVAALFLERFRHPA